MAVKFDVSIAVDGPGSILFNIFLCSGFILIGAVLVFLFYNFIRKETVGR